MERFQNKHFILSSALIYYPVLHYNDICFRSTSVHPLLLCIAILFGLVLLSNQYFRKLFFDTNTCIFFKPRDNFQRAYDINFAAFEGNMRNNSFSFIIILFLVRVLHCGVFLLCKDSTLLLDILFYLDMFLLRMAFLVFT